MPCGCSSHFRVPLCFWFFFRFFSNLMSLLVSLDHFCLVLVLIRILSLYLFSFWRSSAICLLFPFSSFLFSFVYCSFLFSFCFCFCSSRFLFFLFFFFFSLFPCSLFLSFGSLKILETLADNHNPNAF